MEFPREEFWSGMTGQPQNQKGMKEKSSSTTIPSTSPMALLMIQVCGPGEGPTDFSKNSNGWLDLGSDTYLC